MEATLNTLPNNKNIKRRLEVPISISVTPTRQGLAKNINVEQKDLVRCKMCQSYLSKNCEIADGTWKCAICATKNPFTETEITKLQLSEENYEVYIQKPVDAGEIVAFYLSCDFEATEFARAKLALIGALRHIAKGTKCLIFIGTESSPFAILVPPQEPVITNSAYDYNTIQPYTVLNPIALDHADKQTAALAKFNSINAFIGHVLSNFLFTSDNIATAERAISKLQQANDPQSTMKSAQIAITMGRAVEGTPLRFISFVSQLNRLPPIVDTSRNIFVRIDYVVARFSKYFNQARTQVPGHVVILSHDNPGGQGAHMASQRTIYQLVTRCRARNCGVEWRNSNFPPMEIDGQVLYSQVVCSDSQPFVADLAPLPNQPRVAFQLTSKFIVADGEKTAFVFRVMNFVLSTSDKFGEIAASINWNCLLWMWIRASSSRPNKEAVSALYHAVARLVASARSEGVEVPREFIRAVTASAEVWALSDEPVLRFVGMSLLAGTAPSELAMIPRAIGNTLLTPNGAEQKSDVDEGAKAYNDKLAIFVPIRSTWNERFVDENKRQADIIEKLVAEIKQ